MRVVKVKGWRVTAAVTPGMGDGPRVAGLLIESTRDAWRMAVLMSPARVRSNGDPMSVFPSMTCRETLPFIGALVSPGAALANRLARVRPLAARGLEVLRREVDDPSGWPSVPLARTSATDMSAWAQVLRWASCGAGPLAAEVFMNRGTPPLLRSSEGGDLLGWYEAGFTDLDEVAKWLLAKVNHPTRAALVKNKGMGAAEAVEWVLSPFPLNSSLIAPLARERGWTPEWTTVVLRDVSKRVAEDGGKFRSGTREARTMVWQACRTWDKVCSPRQARDLTLAGFTPAGVKNVLATTGALPDDATVQTLIALRL
jgi:hypothetical protein